MKITALHSVHKTRYGRVTINNHDLLDHERDTIFRLASFGFSVETIVPSNIPKSKNPDLLMFGTFWEMKAPTKMNKSTIITKFRKAIKQSSGCAIFDLSNAKTDSEKIEKYILSLFNNTRSMRRIIIIRDNNTALDVKK